jgi:AcrR family transcriptional regulator
VAKPLPHATGERKMSRREEYAEATKQAIVDAARQLFGEKGFTATKVDEIAVAARVSPATVYAVTGGKLGLLRTLVDRWSAAPEVTAAAEWIEQSTDPVELLRYIAKLSREMRQDYGDIMRLVLSAAAQDKVAADGLATGTLRYREGLAGVAKRLATLGALREGIDSDEALDILWFYFGYAGFFTFVDDNGWTYAKTERWLCDAAIEALLSPSCARPAADMR